MEKQEKNRKVTEAKGKKKPELLAPAGNYAGFLGAVHAGADAVYLGGKSFGARAYAENFSQEEIRTAVTYAHSLHRKVYLTVNTLFREEEMKQLGAYLQPLYEAGLDAVIVQDLGVFRFCRTHFPGLALHISTQLCVTGSRGAAFLKEMGASRIVPARELSLAELKQIRQAADVELETFIHGSLCYSYSGQCLFSSMLGGRSGNRGRCAQPCRLPYRILYSEGRPVCREQDGERYPLSLKDLCVIDFLPELIRAGIDSFKIEGRMKSPEYTAGVTAIYRKYIDSCVDSDGQYDGGRDCPVLKEDREQLEKLYIRTQVQSGYYHRHNGKEMVTLEKPGYLGGDDALLSAVRSRYLERPLQAQVQGEAFFAPNEAARLTVRWEDVSVQEAGEVVQEAQKQPLTNEVIRKQLTRTGQELFCFQSLEIRNAGNCFLPVKALNALRRQAFEKLEAAVSAATGRTLSGVARKQTEGSEREWRPEENDSLLPGSNAGVGERPDTAKQYRTRLSVSFLQKKQLKTLLTGKVRPARIYLSADCLEEDQVPRTNGKSEIKEEGRKEIRLPAYLNAYLEEYPETELYLALPYGLRGQDCVYPDSWEPLIRSEAVQGLLVRNLEGLAWARKKKLRETGKRIVLDQSLYSWNRESDAFWRQESDGWTAPLELQAGEIRRLPAAGREWIVYGRVPMMVTAGCLQKTAGVCSRKWEDGGMREPSAGVLLQLEDRRRVRFPVYQNCRLCMNVIYNSVPLSLHGALQEGWFDREEAVRLDFTVEEPAEAAAVLDWFGTVLEQKPAGPFPVPDYTTGHFRKGAE